MEDGADNFQEINISSKWLQNVFDGLMELRALETYCREWVPFHLREQLANLDDKTSKNLINLAKQNYLQSLIVKCRTLMGDIGALMPQRYAELKTIIEDSEKILYKGETIKTTSDCRTYQQTHTLTKGFNEALNIIANFRLVIIEELIKMGMIMPLRASKERGREKYQ